MNLDLVLWCMYSGMRQVSTLIRTSHEVMVAVHGAEITGTGTLDKQEEEREDV